MEIKRLEDGCIVFSSPSNVSPKLSPSNYAKGYCIRIHKCVTNTPFFNFFIPFILIICCMIALLTFKEYAKATLFWIERQNSIVIFVVLVALFTVVSFPIVVGYLLLIISSGYLLGMTTGLLAVVLGANLGVFIAHNVIKAFHKIYPVHRFIKNETGRAILRVISGTRQFKIVLFCRLTPIPFGLQNTIFGISSVKSRNYHTATLLGLLPAQIINVYFGTKLKYIHDVFNDHHTQLASYGVFVMEVLIGVGLMLWIVHKARHELSNALISNKEVDESLLIEVSTS